MVNDLVNVPNWGFDDLVIYKRPYEFMQMASKRAKVHYYFLLKIYNMRHQDVNIMYHSSKRILSSVELMSTMDGQSYHQFNFARFVKKVVLPKEFTWKKKVVAVVPFEAFLVNKSILEYIKFHGLEKKKFVYGKPYETQLQLDVAEVFSTLNYLFNSRTNKTAEFDEYMDYWVKCVVHDVKNGNIYRGEGSEFLNEEFKQGKVRRRNK